jgi:hypothetical protein
MGSVPVIDTAPAVFGVVAGATSPCDVLELLEDPVVP